MILLGLALIALLAVALLVGGVLLFIAVRHQGEMAKLPLPRFVRFAFLDHTPLGEPCAADRVLHRAGYSLGYDDTLRAARWASYVVSADSHTVGNKKVEREDASFRIDPDIPRGSQRSSGDYKGSGFDRGHLAPSDTVDFTSKSNQETFYMSNVVPQHPRLNRQGWRSLEHDVRRWTKARGRMVVVCGPIYADPPRTHKGLFVPSHFFKVVYAWDDNRAIGFVFPNGEVRAAQRWSLACSVREVERAAGVRLFRGPRWWLRRVDKSAADVDWWKKA